MSRIQSGSRSVLVLRAACAVCGKVNERDRLSLTLNDFLLLLAVDGWFVARNEQYPDESAVLCPACVEAVRLQPEHDARFAPPGAGVIGA